MPTQQTTSSRDCGKGKFRFVLGHGRAGVFGHVELTLQATTPPGHHNIQWPSKGETVPTEARKRIESTVSDYLDRYISQHPGLGFTVTITEIGYDPDRRNDYERAASVALRLALEEMNLSVPQIFGL